jgi:hypothetical protein
MRKSAPMKPSATLARSGVRPAVDLHHVAAPIEVVVDGVGVGDEIALVAGEDVVDGVARVVARELEEHVSSGRDEDPEVPCPAPLRVLNENARRVDAEVRLRERVRAHRGHERLDHLGKGAVPSAHGGARELDAVACGHVLAAVEGHVLLPAPDDRVREHAGSRESSRDGQLERLGDEDFSLRVALAILGHELRPDDPGHDERRRAPLDRLAHVLADALERIQAPLLDLGRQHLDLDAR